MIQVIGILVALYIMTRMMNLLIDKHKETNIITMLFAVITFLGATGTIFYLLFAGSSVFNDMNQIMNRIISK